MTPKMWDLGCSATDRMPFSSSRSSLLGALASKSKGPKMLLPGMELLHHYWRNTDVNPECVGAGKGRLQCWRLGVGTGALGCWEGTFTEALSGAQVCRCSGPSPRGPLRLSPSAAPVAAGNSLTISSSELRDAGTMPRALGFTSTLARM